MSKLSNPVQRRREENWFFMLLPSLFVVCVCVCLLTCPWACQGQRLIWLSSSIAYHLIFETRYLPEPGACSPGYPGWPMPKVGVTGMCCYSWHITRVLGIWTQVPVLEGAASYLDISSVLRPVFLIKGLCTRAHVHTYKKRRRRNMSKWLEICGHVELENEGFSFSKVLPALNFSWQKCLQEGIEFQNRRS